MALIYLKPGILFNLNPDGTGKGKISPDDTNASQIKAFVEEIDRKTVKFNLSFEINNSELNKSNFSIEEALLIEKGFLEFDGSRINLKRKVGDGITVEFERKADETATKMVITMNFEDGKIRGVGI